MTRRFILNETGCHGSGAINGIPVEVKKRGFKKALVVTDAESVEFGVAGGFFPAVD